MADTIQVNGRGVYYDFDRPELHDWKVYEIASALSKICRFTGNTSHFYSVAQHSVYVSRLVPWEYRMEGLMHDAHESVMGDVSSPLKRKLPEYKVLEKAAEASLASQFGLCWPYPEDVKIADLRMLVTEKKAFMPVTPQDGQHWPDTFRYAPFRIGPMEHEKAKEFFMMEYLAIKQGAGRQKGGSLRDKGWVGPLA